MRILKRLCREETHLDFLHELFADDPVRQNGNSVNVREFLKMS